MNMEWKLMPLNDASTILCSQQLQRAMWIAAAAAAGSRSRADIVTFHIILWIVNITNLLLTL